MHFSYSVCYNTIYLSIFVYYALHYYATAVVIVCVKTPIWLGSSCIIYLNWLWFTDDSNRFGNAIRFYWAAAAAVARRKKNKNICYFFNPSRLQHPRCSSSRLPLRATHMYVYNTHIPSAHVCQRLIGTHPTRTRSFGVHPRLFSVYLKKNTHTNIS